MRIASFADKEGSAIDRLCQMNIKRFPHLNIEHGCVHPKRPSEKEIDKAKQMIAKCDVIDFQYWKTAVTIRGIIPEANSKKMILTMHNEHNIEGDWDWKKFKWDLIIVKNGWQKQKLVAEGFDPLLIKHACEFDDFRYIDKLNDQRIVGYVGQIKKNKGVRELKQACDELGYRLLVVGNISEGGYWENLDKNNLMFYTKVPDSDLGKLFHQMRIYCANSDDGTESGTMPILEAMASGIPVVTRKIGLVRDCGEDKKNMVIRKGKYTDIEDLKASLKLVMENSDIANQLRENAWRTVRQYHPEIQAREYNKLYHQVFHGNNLVSIIIPTFNRAEVLLENLESLKQQSYKNFEVIVCDDGSTDETYLHLKKSNFPFPIRYINTGDTDSYGLAKARNLGVIEAIGDILVFCDDRLRMHHDAIKNFVNKLENIENRKIWLWGSKGVFKSFVENFSATWRRSFIDGGMFNERIDTYGGMTQEIAGRYGAQGFQFEFCPQALAEPTVTTHSKSKNRQNIINQKIRLYKMGFQ